MSSTEEMFAHGRAAGVKGPEGYEAVFYTGYNAHIGPIFSRFTQTDAKLTSHSLVNIEDRHLNGAGFIHGGMLMSLADIAIGSTVSRALEGGGASTVSLSCDFLAAGKLGDQIQIEAEITRRTRSVVFAAGRLFVERAGEERLTLLTASGIWKIIGAP